MADSDAAAAIGNGAGAADGAGEAVRDSVPGIHAAASAGIAPALLALLVDRINVGVLTVSPDDMTVLQWNAFLHAHTGVSAAEVVGRNLFERFPELDRRWIERKIHSVVLLKAFAFSSWQQRPYIFRFQDHRPMTLGGEPMRQDCAFLPLVEGQTVRAVSLILTDATETYQSQSKLDQALAALAAQSERDGLTGVYNRRRLDEAARVELARARRYGNELGLTIFDIDHFKKVNDRFGHLAGDEAIRHVARLAAGLLRTTDVIGRYGGEEFVVLLPGTGLEGSVAAAERVRGAIEATPVVWEGTPIPLTISAGVTVLRAETADVPALLGEADRALYQSKHGGRNRTTAHRHDGPAGVAG